MQPNQYAALAAFNAFTMQLDQPERGFSFQADGPLDMRMSQDGESAADFLNTADEAVIADVLYDYGEERQSRRVARAIVAARPITRTGELAAVVRRAGRRRVDGGGTIGAVTATIEAPARSAQVAS